MHFGQSRSSFSKGQICRVLHHGLPHLPLAVKNLINLAVIYLQVGIIILIMAFVHTGHLLFGGLHTMFKSFGDTFLLVSNFFRLEGVNHYQGPAVEERPVLILVYFAVFVAGFYTIMRGAVS